MKTINELTAARIENHEAFFARKKALGTAMEKLVDIYNATTRPDATVAAFKVEVGEDAEAMEDIKRECAAYSAKGQYGLIQDIAPERTIWRLKRWQPSPAWFLTSQMTQYGC